MFTLRELLGNIPDDLARLQQDIMVMDANLASGEDQRGFGELSFSSMQQVNNSELKSAEEIKKEMELPEEVRYINRMLGQILEG